MKGAVDRAVRGFGSGAEASEVFEGAVVRLGPGRLQCLGPFVRAGEAEHPVPGEDEFFGDGGADESGRTGQEYTHIVRWFGLVNAATIGTQSDGEK